MLARFGKRFAGEQEGTVLVETLLAVPVMLLLTFGILEFGNMMWQRQQMQVGVRDAARYWARCRPVESLGGGATQAFMNCDVATARNIAFHGNPQGTGPLRVPGWDEANEITIEPAVPDTLPAADDLVTVSGEFTYQGSPVFDAVLGQAVTISYWTQTRYLGW